MAREALDLLDAEMSRATVIADASYCHHSGAAGWAAWIRIDGVPTPIKKMGPISKSMVKTSADAEVRAAIFGAQEAINNGACIILVQSDCQAVCDMNHPAWLDFAKKNQDVIFDGRHVKGHTNGSDARSWVNNWCDTWAKREMRRKRKMLK
jgi:ribonuclease HI